MRLLKVDPTGGFSLTDDLLDNERLKYAILSHTWHIDNDQEVTSEDLSQGTAKNKSGYKKISFCAKQAIQDSIQHIWVDTCCIDKSSNNANKAIELQYAINSMFRWYQNAAKCYVYLEDVPDPEIDAGGEFHQTTWELSLRKSRWFTRGWTLQELIAPKVVEFYSQDCRYIGSKASLELEISDITSIPIQALRGTPLDGFSITERVSWSKIRQTKFEEDKVYSLFGVFSVFTYLNYGEGKDHAFRRLYEEIDRVHKGIKFEEFSVSFSLDGVSETDHFVARETELAQIRDILTSDGSRQIAVLHGLGGIGKTQLTVAYTKRYRHNYSAVFWLNIKDVDSLKQSFVKVAKQILRDHPSASRLSNLDINGNLDEVVEAVKAWLSLPKNTRWLLIYDNYDNPKVPSNNDAAAIDIRKFFPESYQGSIIITTRLAQVKVGRQVPIKKLTNMKDSLQILANASGRQLSVDDADAVNLVNTLDGLPLALATAGAYLSQVATTLAEYLSDYDASWLDLQETTPEVTEYKDRMLYSTWQISYDHVQRQNKLSAKLLQLWGYFDNQDIWLELLQHTDQDDPEWIREITKDKIRFNAAVRVLCDHGLVEVDQSPFELIESRGYSVHGCVHAWMIHVLNRNWDGGLARLALKFVGSHVPGNEKNKWWVTQRRLLQHASRCSNMLIKDSVAGEGIEWAMHMLGYLYADQGKLDEAEKMYERALVGKEKAWGPDHTSTLDTVNNLGILYADQGKLDEAEKMYERALVGQKKSWGPDHTSTLNTVNNLGILYKSQGKLDKAEKMYERALVGKEKAWGPDHTSTLDTVNNLGNLYADQSKLDEAEKMYERALVGKEKAWGPDHTSTLDTVNNLGLLYAFQGKLDQAEEMYERALVGFEKAWGPDHTSILDTVNNLGNLYTDQGKLDEAEKMYKRALVRKEKAWGPDHTSTLDTVNNLGILYKSQGKLDKAEKMYERALVGFEKAWGPDHTSTLNTVNNLGLLYADQGKLDEAEKMYERALVGKEKAWGSDHTSILDTVNNLGNLYADQGKLDEAEKMYKRALVGKEKAWGPDHTSTFDTVNNLGLLYAFQGKLDQAEEMCTRAVEGYINALGPDHLSTLNAIDSYGSICAKQGKLEEAETTYWGVLHRYEKVLGSGQIGSYAPALETMENLALLLKRLGKVDESKRLYTRAQHGIEIVFGQSSSRYQAVIEALARLSADEAS